MRTARPAIALDPRRFGRRVFFSISTETAPTPAVSDDLRLFAISFAAGFLFVSILIA